MMEDKDSVSFFIMRILNIVMPFVEDKSFLHWVVLIFFSEYKLAVMEIFNSSPSVMLPWSAFVSMPALSV